MSGPNIEALGVLASPERINLQSLFLEDLWRQEIQQRLNDLVPAILSNQDDWAGCGVVAAIDEKENLVGLVTVGRELLEKRLGETNYWKMRRPAVAKAQARLALDKGFFAGGVAANWEELKESCSFPYHAGDAVARMEGGRKLYIGVTMGEATPEHLCRELGVEATPTMLKFLSTLPDVYFTQAGFFDTKLAHTVANALSGRSDPLPSVNIDLWEANS